ncbi:MAG: protein kinase [Cyanobacteria bacterium CRU_2_1]|nr:protein kinase [Cyanobacteria bacterium RU_5_0]NJR62483.1 protein kinase [Cyanobacteria bacterium CRU_2_1]
MSYCLNPSCRKPHNPDNAKFCQTCGWRLLLDGRYRALKLIGQGGFGRTFLAVDETLHPIPLSPHPPPSSPALCVIKQLFPRQPGIDSDKAVALFRQEAERLAELGQHPQIPALLAHFELEDAQYLVQEFIDGQNLEEVLTQGSVFSEAQIRELLTDLLPVLRFIHSHQVIHRDIKPENIILPRTGDHYALVDFGASKYVTETIPARTGTVIGSAGYVAPEQAIGKAEFASDLYSLGVTCIHLLTGLHPFDLYSVSEDAWIWRQYLSRPISSSLRRLLDKLLQRATNQRYRTAAQVLQDLRVEPESPSSISKPSTVKQRHQPTDLESWHCTQTLAGHEGEVTAIAISPYGRILASGSRDRSIKFWSLETGELLHTFAGRSFWFRDGHGDAITALAYSPDGQTLISSSADGTIKWWDLFSKTLITTLPAHGWGISTIVLSSDGYLLASGDSDGLIQLWDLDTEELVVNLAKHQNQVTALVIDSGGHTLVSSSYDGTICLWELQTDDLIKTLKAHPDRVNTIALTPDGRTLISGSRDRTVKLWDLDYGEQLKVLAAHRDAVNSVAIDPTGQIFASGSEDSTIKLWDLETGDRLCTVRHSWAVNAIGFSPDGKLLVSGSADETIKIWQRKAS